MLKDVSRTPRVIRIWFAALTTIVVLSVALGARWSTTALLLAMSATPMAVALLLGFGGARSLTPHELLHAVDHRKQAR